jgi:hypothetical protein
MKQARLEKWWPEYEGFHNVVFLHGFVFEHPYFVDGSKVKTSLVQGKRNGRVVTCNTEYELGAPESKYNYNYPGGKDKLLEGLKEV